MSLDTSAASRYIDHGSASALDDIPTNYRALTVWAWVYRTGGGGNQQIVTKDGSSAFPYAGWIFQCDAGAVGAGQLRFVVLRGDPSSKWTNVWAAAEVVPLNQWTFVAVVHDEDASGATRARLYTGSLTSPVAPVTAYEVEVGGTGAMVSDATYLLYVGSLQRAPSTTFKGTIARAGIYGSRLTLDQLQRVQRTAWIERMRDIAPNCLLAADYLTGDTTQRDHSGKGHHGTVTGAVVAPHLPVSLLSIPLPPWVTQHRLARRLASADTTLAASVTATATHAAALTTGITAAGSLSASTTASAALTTAIQSSASVTASASVSAALSTAVQCAASVTATTTASAALTTAISMGASVTGAASVSADLVTASTLAGGLSAFVTTTAALSTAITCAAGVSVAASVSAALTAGQGLAVGVQASATATASLSTSVTLASSVTSTAQVSAAITTGITCAGAVTGSATATADLLTASELAASISSSALVVGTLTTTIACAAVASVSMNASAALSVGPIREYLAVTLREQALRTGRAGDGQLSSGRGRRRAE